MSSTFPNYDDCTSRALAFLTRHIVTENASCELKDLCCFYKAPMMFISAGKIDLAQKVLDHIKTHYMNSSADFVTDFNVKSAKGEYAEFWGYINDWILRAAQICGREDITVLAHDYLDT